ncbi:MAG: outer membrane protein assembly factor BamA [Magnetococcales bacterium]|nr:outer membrane protein assembly factor BamA [Magnetococcales bacterium]
MTATKSGFRHWRQQGLRLGAVLFLACWFGGTPQGQTAENIQRIEVSGNRRIETDTVKSYLAVREGESFDAPGVQKSMKDLYDTGFFKEVSLEREGGSLVVRVVENPVIHQITFEGLDAFSEEELKKTIKLQENDIYNRAKVERDLTALRQAYRIKGLFLAKVEMLQKPRDENAIDLVYRITEGQKSKVQSVRIIGNQQMSYKDLTKKMMIQSSGWFSWLTEDDTYDREKLLFDQSHLRNVYLNNGYVRVKVSSSVAELTPDKQSFVVTHAVEEGERYKFGPVSISGDFDELPPEALREALKIKEGAWYSREKLRESVEALSDKVGDFGYAFLEVDPGTTIHDDSHTVDVAITVKKGRRVYLNRIDIVGNNRTRDEVIRREMRFAEGDRFSASKVRRSRQRLDNLNFFEKVDITTQPVPATEDRINIKVDVAEKSTGAFSIGAGFSTADQFIGTASLSQNNFLGLGQQMVFSFAISSRTSEYDLSFTEPYFLGRDISAGVDLFNRKMNRMDVSAYKQDSYGGGLRLGFPINEFLDDRVSYQYSYVTLTDVAENASQLIKDQATRSPYSQSMISNVLTWNTLDHNLLPTAGQRHKLTTDFSGVGGDVHFLRLITDHSLFHTLWDDKNLVGHLKGRLGLIEGLNEDVPIYERFFVGGPYSLRGFKKSGVGPRTVTGEAYGGTYMATTSAELLFPILGMEDKGIRAVTFLDAGILNDMDTVGATVLQDSDPRVSTGVGLRWNSPFGPLRFELGFPLRKREYDRPRTFDFSIGTAL